MGMTGRRVVEEKGHLIDAIEDESNEGRRAYHMAWLGAGHFR